MANPFSNGDKLYEPNFAMLRHLENSINGIPNYPQLFQIDPPLQNNYIDKINRYTSDYKVPEVFDYSNPRSFNNVSHYNNTKSSLNGDNLQPSNSRGVVHLQHQDHHPKYFPVSDMLDNEHICCICNKVFKDSHNLKVHMKDHYHKNSVATVEHFEQSEKIDQLIPPTSAPYKCHICNLIFNSGDQLKSHEMIMHQPSPGYQCKFCKKSFEKPIQLKDHINKVHGEEQEREYVCCECGCRFSNKHDLANHSMAVHGTLQCSECGAKFIQADLLQQHMMSHAEIKSFACTQCGMTFTKRSSLKQHIKISHNRVLSKCSECGETFNRVKELRRHLQVFHGKELDDSMAGSSMSTEEHSAVDSNIEESIQLNTNQREESSASEDESLNQLNNILGIKSDDAVNNVSFLDQLTDTGAMEFADYLKNQDHLSTPIHKMKPTEAVENTSFSFEINAIVNEQFVTNNKDNHEFSSDFKIKQEASEVVGLTCIVCSLPFETEEQLIEHLKEHLNCVMDADDSLLKPGPGRPRKKKKVPTATLR